jgi:hypothetical protein
MEWTTDKPTKQGWYWVYRKYNLVLMADVTEFSLPDLQIMIGDIQWGFEDFTHFMGPIPQPPPPTISADQAQKANV